jgi:hypothetical protein
MIFIMDHAWQQSVYAIGLMATLGVVNNVKIEMEKLPKKNRERLHYLPPGINRWKERSKTFYGIAKAMASQWGVLQPERITA